MEKTINYYTAYAPANDTTYLMCEEWSGDEVISIECVSWICGDCALDIAYNSYMDDIKEGRNPLKAVLKSADE